MDTFWIIVVAAALRVGLLIYGDWQDRHFDVKYTDIDYFVYSDAASYVTQGASPYDRLTYRYAPLPAWLLTPNALLTPLWGKIVFSGVDLAVAYLMHLSVDRGATRAAALWLFNPFTFTISTRGNCDSVTVFLLLLLLRWLHAKRYEMAGVLWGISIHWRLFPVIYAPTLLIYLLHNATPETPPRGALWRLVSREVIGFGMGAMGSVVSLGALFHALYPDGYVENAVLYHAARLDPRHNFSLVFYPTYLSHWHSPDLETSIGMGALQWIDVGSVSSLCQLMLIWATALKYGHHLPLSFTVTTLIFVAFNKVCTAQYFVWYFGLIPLLVAPQPYQKCISFFISCLIWVLAQGHWLLWAYLLEFQGWSCHLQVWIASCLFLLAHTHLITTLIRITL